MINFLDIWSRQKDFQKHFFNLDTLTDEERIQLVKDHILSTHRELGEILSVLPAKTHRAEKKEYDIEHVREEIIDTFKFVLNVGILFNMTAESFAIKFFEKSKIVEERYEKEKNEISPKQQTLF